MLKLKLIHVSKRGPCHSDSRVSQIQNEYGKSISQCFTTPEIIDCMVFACYGRTYRKTSNISRTLVVSKIVDNSDVVGAAPVGAAPTTSSFST